MIDFVILFACAILFALFGFVVGRVSVTVPQLPHFLGSLNHLADNAIARIAHEARRAHEQSLGVFATKSWNNLAEHERERLTRLVAKIKAGEAAAANSIFGAVAMLSKIF